MKRVRNWLMTIMCLSLMMAVTFDWPMFCKIVVVVNAVALLVCMLNDPPKIVHCSTSSERVVGRTLENIFRSSEKRIIIATFSSNVHRIQKIIDIAVLCNRKVAISGRSMVNVVELAQELGYINIPANVLVDLNKTRNIPLNDPPKIVHCSTITKKMFKIS